MTSQEILVAHQELSAILALYGDDLKIAKVDQGGMDLSLLDTRYQGIIKKCVTVTVEDRNALLKRLKSKSPKKSLNNILDGFFKAGYYVTFI